MKVSNKFNFIVLKELWNKFRDIPITNNDEIDTDFYIWKKGTDRFEIWHWFDDRCPNNLHDDLMFPNK
jgi:hypothetical protein